MTNIVVYTDGACMTYPRIGGWGWTAITSTENDEGLIEWDGCGGNDDTTNQQMELTAMAEALEFCKLGSSIEIWSDSEYTIKGITGDIIKQKGDTRSQLVVMEKYPQGWMRGWKTPNSILGAEYDEDYWNSERLNGYEWYRIHQRILLLSKSGSKISFGWVKGHSGIEGNEKADKLADIHASLKTEAEIKEISVKYDAKVKLSPKAFYAVAKGFVPGIYFTWDDCNKQVRGFSGAKYKKFTTLQEAEVFML